MNNLVIVNDGAKTKEKNPVNSSSKENKTAIIDSLNKKSAERKVSNRQFIKKELLKSDNKANKESHFLDRMLFDLFKRQTKEAKLNTISDKNKPKKNETTIVKTFNRLIDDANRRLEASYNLELIKNIIDTSKSKNKRKKVTENDWNSYYSQSVKSFTENKQKKITEMKEEKEKALKLKEDSLLKERKTKKASEKEIDRIFNRMYEKSTIVTRGKSKDSSSKSISKSIFPTASSSVKNEIKSVKHFKYRRDDKTIKMKNKNIRNITDNITDSNVFDKTSELLNQKQYTISNDINSNRNHQKPRQNEATTSINNTKTSFVSSNQKKHINDLQAYQIVDNIFQRRNTTKK